jgi:hypothetical protein
MAIDDLVVANLFAEVLVALAPELLRHSAGPLALAGILADRADIVIVDAGNWFPPGPIRRHQVSRHAFGCDAVILVRRADFPPCVAHAESLAAIGLRVLGEVETFADDAAHPARESPDA